MDDHIEVVAASTGIFANKTLCVGLIDSFLKLDLFIPELSTNVDVGSLGAHAEANHEGAFDELMRVVSEDLAILASAWL